MLIPRYDVITEDFYDEVKSEATNASGITVEPGGFLRVRFHDDSIMILNGNLFRSVTLSPKDEN